MKDYSYEVLPLSEKEKAWMRRLEKVLLACPDRLVLQTVGDPDLAVIDKNIVEKYSLDTEDNKANEHGVVVGHVSSGCQIWGVSG